MGQSFRILLLSNVFVYLPRESREGREDARRVYRGGTGFWDGKGARRVPDKVLRISKLQLANTTRRVSYTCVPRPAEIINFLGYFRIFIIIKW